MQNIVFSWLVTVVLHEPPARVGVAQMSLMAPSIFLMLLGVPLAGPLAIDHVPQPRSVYRLVEQLAG